LRDKALWQPVARTWHDSIPTASAIEAEMWLEREALIQLEPSSAEGVRVLARFPKRIFSSCEGEATLDYDRIHLATWKAPVFFTDIESVSLADAFGGKKRLTLVYRPSGGAGTSAVEFVPQDYVGDGGDLLAAFQLYYRRYQTAAANRG
jgi:hypothetical protein